MSFSTPSSRPLPPPPLLPHTTIVRVASGTLRSPLGGNHGIPLEEIMRRYKSVVVNEAKMGELFRQSPRPHRGRPPLRRYQCHTRGGRLNVLLVESGHALVVAELKVVEDDNMLIQTIDYYDYVSTNLEAPARIYASFEIDPRASLACGQILCTP